MLSKPSDKVWTPAVDHLEDHHLSGDVSKFWQQLLASSGTEGGHIQ